MKIESITLQNFQCFGEEPTTIRLGDFTALIGGNGTGKSAVLQALCRAFGIAPGQRGLQRSDFHVPPLKKGESPPKAISLSIDLRLGFPELAPGQPEGTAVPPCFRHMAIDRPGAAPFCRIRIEGTWHATNLAEGEIDEHIFWINSNKDEPTEENKTGFGARDRGLVHVIYVPAARDPAREIRAASAALIGRLLTAIEWAPDLRKHLADGSEELDKLVTGVDAIGTIQETLLKRWQSLHDDPLYANPALRFTVGDLEDFLRRVEVIFGPTPGDGHDNLSRLSDGMKSLFYFAMVAALFDIERQAATEAPAGTIAPAPLFDLDRLAPAALTLLAVEEPENHVAPQLLGRISELLKTVSCAPAGQVVITSHSAGILSRVDPTDVRYLRLVEQPQLRRTQVREIVLPDPADEAHKYIKEAVRAYPELYFARLVILGEGDSEEVIFPRILRSAGIGLDAKLISVVPLGGRHVNHFWRLLADLAIPFITLLDLDLERDGGGWGRIRTTCKELLAIKVSRSPLLDTTDGLLSDEELDTLEGDAEQLELWLDELERHNVFFSAPLDLDLMMLEAFRTEYQSLAVRGPRVPAKGTPAYQKRLASATTAVLGDEGGDGSTFTTEQRELFPWYSYLFLGRGKPSTHVLALSKLSDAEIEASLPAVLRRLRKQVAAATTTT
jgi:hypothetical protein